MIFKKTCALRLLLLAAALLAVLSAVSCSTRTNTLKDGYYTAAMADYDAYGWKEFLIIYVRDGQIVSADYNAKNASGFIKSWDMDYMREMNAVSGTYPSEYVRLFTDDLLMRQNPQLIDAVTGATHSHTTFKLLAEAAVAQAKAGNRNIAYVDAQEQ